MPPEHSGEGRDLAMYVWHFNDRTILGSPERINSDPEGGSGK